jgi:hypothetical protein
MAGKRLLLRARKTAQAQPTPNIDRKIALSPLTPSGDHINGPCIAANKKADDTIEHNLQRPRDTQKQQQPPDKTDDSPQPMIPHLATEP